MKTFTALFVAMFLSLSLTFADDKADSTFVSTWVQALPWLGPVVVPTQAAIDAMPRKEIFADSVSGFDAQGSIFDEEWAKIPGNGNAIANPTGLAASNEGAADFTGAFKVLYDDANIYILLKYLDDDVTGLETVQLMWAPYLKLYAPKFTKLTANYFRYSQFGATKATFTKTGYKNSMLITPTKDAYTINWSGTTPDLTATAYLDDKTEPASNTVKQIITLGYAAITGEARLAFDPSIWRATNGGKGISFDIRVKDIDALDDMQPAVDPETSSKAADYNWNSTVNDGYVVTYLSGFLAPAKLVTGIADTKFENRIFGKVTSNQIQLTTPADVTVYNAIGKQVLTAKNTSLVELSSLGKGVFVIRANSQTIKLIR